MLVIITIIYAIAHQWISDLLGSDAVESPDHNQVWGEEVPGRYEREKEDNGACDVDSPDITIEDKVLEGEPGDVDDDEEGEGGDAASLGGWWSQETLLERKKLYGDMLTMGLLICLNGDSFDVDNDFD